MPSQNSDAVTEPPKPQYNTPHIQRSLPALARVKQAKVPNAYDNTQLKLEASMVVVLWLWRGKRKEKERKRVREKEREALQIFCVDCWSVIYFLWKT